MKVKINVKILAALVAVFFVAVAVCCSVLYAIYDTSLKPAEFENLNAPASGIDTGYYRYCYFELSAEEQAIYTVILESIYDMPENLKNAFVAIEDKRFYKHNGIDFIAIVEALWRDLKERRLAAGGSTITQQLCKNQFFTQKKLFTRKIAEVFMVREIENSYTKNEILELYINSIYYGNGYYSLADAGAGYFGKTVAELNAWECTLLAGLPNAPSAYAPNKHPELALQRQTQVLNAMVKYDFITQKQAKEILQQCPENFL